MGKRNEKGCLSASQQNSFHILYFPPFCNVYSGYAGCLFVDTHKHTQTQSHSHLDLVHGSLLSMRLAFFIDRILCMCVRVRVKCTLRLRYLSVFATICYHYHIYRCRALFAQCSVCLCVCAWYAVFICFIYAFSACMCYHTFLNNFNKAYGGHTSAYPWNKHFNALNNQTKKKSWFMLREYTCAVQYNIRTHRLLHCLSFSIHTLRIFIALQFIFSLSHQ